MLWMSAQPGELFFVALTTFREKNELRMVYKVNY